MDYNTDKAIENCDQDLLGRASFSRQLGKAIYEYKGNDSLVIGLFGKWGTGKTSVINMALQEIAQLSIENADKPLVMKFAPWNYSDKDNLISLFFRNLKLKIDKEDNTIIKQKVGKALSDYSSAFDAISLVPVVGSGLAALFKTIAQTEGEKLARTPDLDQLRDGLEKALVETRQKIIVVIDDIDRLGNCQIRDIFQLVKQVADFPNIIYVLAMDREVVTRALEDVHGYDGNEYLEKIVQIPFMIPELSRTKLNNVFCGRLDKIIKDSSTEITWDQNYWEQIFSNCIEPYLCTLRDVNRVINTFQFKFNLLCGETSFEDMIALTTIEVLEPKLFKWISANKECVCGGLIHGLSFNNKKPDEIKNNYISEFKELGIDSEKAMKCVAAIFPVFAKDIDEYSWNYYSQSNARGKMRVAHEERFELYFMLDLDEIEIPRSVINSCIYNLSAEEFKEMVITINTQGHAVYFLKELRSLIEKIPYNRLPLLVETLFEIQAKLQGEDMNALFPFSATSLAGTCIDDMFDVLKSQDERFEILENVTRKATKYGLGSVAREINRIELAYGRLTSESEKKNDQIISLDQLEKLEKMYAYQVVQIAKQETIIDVDDFHYAFYIWECFDPKAAAQYVDNLFMNSVNKLKFVCKMAGGWRGTGGVGWSFNPKNYSKYISDEEIKQAIDEFDKLEMESCFSELELIKLASFYLNYTEDNGGDNVNEQRARVLVKKWIAKE